MAYVDHHVDAEIAADGALVGFARVGGPEQGADLRDGVIAGEREGDDGRLLHEALHIGEEGLGRDVRVMLPEEGVAEAKHLDAADLETGGFEPTQHLSDEGFADGVGFEQNECGFL